MSFCWTWKASPGILDLKPVAPPYNRNTEERIALLTRERLVAIVVLLTASAAPARAQIVLGDTETLEFDRPEAWGMKYYASLGLLTSMGVPERRAPGEVDARLRGGLRAAAERRGAPHGLQRHEARGREPDELLRPRCGAAWASARAWRSSSPGRPPSSSGGPRRNSSPRRSAARSGFGSWRLGVRGYGQIGKIKADITCSADEVAAGDDLEQNPFLCVEPSEDESHQKVDRPRPRGRLRRAPRFKPYAAFVVSYMDLEFRINALYCDGLIEDHTVQLTSGTTLSATAGVTYAAGGPWRITAEPFYAWLSSSGRPRRAPPTRASSTAACSSSYRVHWVRRCVGPARVVAALAGLALCAPGASLGPVLFAVDPEESHVRIQLGRAASEVHGPRAPHRGARRGGSVEVVDGDPARSSVTLRFAAAGLFVIPGSEPADDIPKVEERMRGPEVLEVARYPEIVFVSASVRSGVASGRVSGSSCPAA